MAVGAVEIPLRLSSPLGEEARPAAPGHAAAAAAAAARLPDSVTFGPSALAHLERIFEKVCSDAAAAEGETKTRGKCELDGLSVRAFLRAVQSETVRADGSPRLLQHGVVGMSEFLAYMASCEADAVAPPPPGSRDLAQPISSYYVSSSHNTYLTGNQISSMPSVEPYRNVLLRGCRCVEIDVWNGKSPPTRPACSESKDKRPSWKGERRETILDPPKSESVDVRTGQYSGKCSPHASNATPKPAMPIPRLHVPPSRPEPHVLHGYTQRKGVSFRDVCFAIRDAAFVTTDLPVVISLEVHASPEQQEIMVEIMKEAWRGLLVDDQCLERVRLSRLPSPDELRRKLLIKVKGPPLDTEIAAGQVRGDEKQGRSRSGAKPAPVRKVIEALSSLAVYTKGYTFEHFGQPEASLPAHVFSLSEVSVRSILKTNDSLLLAHNRDFLMRVFPSRMRMDSSNFDPCFFWRQGIQMVVLNWQRLDKGMILNEAMFAGEEGWTLKPREYRPVAPLSVPSTNCRGANGAISHETRDDMPARRAMSLTLTLFAGQGIPQPASGRSSKACKSYVVCELHVARQTEMVNGIAISQREQRTAGYKQRSSAKKGLNPDFQGEELHMPPVLGVIDELSFLRLEIKRKKIAKDELAAFACIRLDRLRSGYRFLHFLDTKGMQIECALLVKISRRSQRHC